MRRLLTFSSLALALIATPTYAQNLLTDGSFDLATSGTQTSGSPWTLSVNFPDGTDPSARFQTGFGNSENNSTQSPGTGSGVWFRAFEGDQGGVGDPLADATITQSVVAAAGGRYRLTFRAAIEGIPNFDVDDFSVTLSSSGTGGSATVDLIAESGSIIDGNIGGAASANLHGTPFNINLLGVSPGDTLTVTGQMLGGIDSGTNPQSGFLDRFSLLAIPEPTSALLLGLGSLGMLLRRRR